MKLTKLIPKVSVSERIEYPLIAPVPEGIHRPFWSVMIPTYNRANYLNQTLRGVLEQDPGPDEMQIEIVDNCSTQDDPEKVVRKVGQNRVSSYRQPHHVSISANWNTCIKRALGHWVHILHEDDMVLPGFYSRLREDLGNAPTIGAAFCRYIIMDEEGHWQSLSPLETRTPGILPNWLERITIVQRVQASAIVVRRSVYETLGGFHPELFYAADWEMWKRVAAHYPVWYEPQPVACYRVHSSSSTSSLVRSGANIADTRRAIEISQLYLPRTIAGELSRKSREHYAIYALNEARLMLAMHDVAAAIAQVREAFKCSHSLRVIRQMVHLFTWAGIRWIWWLVRKAASFRYGRQRDNRDL